MKEDAENHERSELVTAITELAQAVQEAEDLAVEFAMEMHIEAQRLSKKVEGQGRS